MQDLLFIWVEIPSDDGVRTLRFGVQLDIAADPAVCKDADPQSFAVAEGKMQFGMTGKVRFPERRFLRMEFLCIQSGQQGSGAAQSAWEASEGFTE